MNETPILQFLEALGSDEKLSAALRDAVGDRRGDDAATAVAAFAQGHGYDLVVADIGRVHQAYAEAQGRTASDAGVRDLADTELDGVDGGLIAETLLFGALVGLVAGSGAAILAGVLMTETFAGKGDLRPKPVVP